MTVMYDLRAAQLGYSPVSCVDDVIVILYVKFFAYCVNRHAFPSPLSTHLRVMLRNRQRSYYTYNSS